ncbi:hypothetical protein [Roseomonas marmotae]|nr:hypothetical protein [Roseomonas marmotae]
MRHEIKSAPITATSLITGLVELPWGAPLFGTLPSHAPRRG